jgi:hypothetical protein
MPPGGPIVCIDLFSLFATMQWRRLPPQAVCTIMAIN